MSAAKESIRFASTTLSTGVRLHYAERGDPTGEAIVFLHGYSDSWFSCRPLLHIATAFWWAHAS